MTLALTALFAFVFGAIIGSFLNVVIHRVPLGESIVSPPSHCPVCDNQIAWYDNIPIVSWLALGGECRHCGTSVSPRYIGVEALVGALSAAVWIKVAGGAGLSEAGLVGIDPALVGVPYFFYFAFVCLVVSIAFIDLEHLIIPHEISIPGIILGIVAGFVLEAVIPPEQLVDMWPPMTSFMSVTGAVVGGGSVIAIFVFYMAVRGIPAMGGGDVTLMALVGAWLGWPAVLFVFFAASIQGLIAYGAAVAFGLEGFVRDAQEIFDEMDEEDEIARVRAPSKPAAPEAGEEVPSEEEAVEEEVAEEEAEDVAEVEDEEVEGEAAASEASGEDEGGAEEVEEADEEEAEEEAEEAEEVEEVEESSEEGEGEVELVVEEEEGPPAIPFGPFIVLGALEHFFLGGLLGPQYSMMMFYLDYF
jgi:leader peptidase (prepilin peptidase)/N-methyltransferase